MPPQTCVLIVDDEPSVRELMSRWVESLGFEPRTAASAEEAMTSVQEADFDVAIVDVVMPGRNGLWLAGELRRDYPHTAVVLATGYADLLDGSAQPVADLLVKPFKLERFALAVDRAREWHRLAVEEIDRHAQLAIQIRAAVAAVVAELKRIPDNHHDELRALTQMAAERIKDVATHSERVARFSVSIARQLKMPEPGLREVDVAARFHDIGKLVIPLAVLTKPSLLAAGEAVLMRQHVDAGAEILEGTRSLRHLAPIVRASHEWFDGSGYPRRLVGTEIPVASRIIAVADAYDAMTQDRIYRGPVGSAEAAAELLRCAPTQFDPDVVRALLEVLSRH